MPVRSSARIVPFVNSLFGREESTPREPGKPDENLLPSVLGYDIVTDLGSGALGDVKLGVCPRTGETVAIKVVDLAKASSRQIEQSDNEISALRALEGAPHCLQLKASSARATMRGAGGRGAPPEPPREVYAQVTEFAEMGDLFELLESGGAFAEAASKALFRQLLAGLRAFAPRGIEAHRDLKPENLLVGGDGALRVADFNLCARSARGTTLHDACGSRSYMAPEVLAAADGAGYRGRPADVWSAAVVLFTCLVGHPPFDEASRRCWFYRKACVEGKAHLFWAAHAQSAVAARPRAEGGVSDAAKALLMRAFCADPAERATLDELAAHAWLAEPSVDDVELTAAELRSEFARRAELVPRITRMRSLLSAHKIGDDSPRGVEEDHYAD